MALGVAAPLVVMPAAAQDVTLTSREGRITLSGTMAGFDGEFYRVETRYGTLTLDAASVICEGPGCPDLRAPKAVIRVMGAADAGARLLPALFSAFSEARGLDWRPATAAPDGSWQAEIRDPQDGRLLGEVSFAPATAEGADAALAAGTAEFALSRIAPAGMAARPVALDALVPIVAPGNPTPHISTADLAHALSGEIRNWAALGGPDMPLVLHAIAPDSDIGGALGRRIGVTLQADVVHPDVRALAEAVAADPWALALATMAEAGAAAVLPLTDSCAFPLRPDPLALAAGDYPLSVPLMVTIPARRLPLLAREFHDFLAMPAAAAVARAQGYAARDLERARLARDDSRLLNAIRALPEDASLAELRRLAALMEEAERLSPTFRFDETGATLDALSQDALADLAQRIAAGQFPDRRLILVGFTDAGDGPSRDAAAEVGRDLATLLPDLDSGSLPQTTGFGALLPLACDDTATGRHMNRRVELWSVPDFAPRVPLVAH